MTKYIRAIVLACVFASALPLGGCGAVALAGVAYLVGKDTGTHVMNCSKTDTGETVCHDTEKGALSH
jgi:hypothetical protein